MKNETKLNEIISRMNEIKSANNLEYARELAEAAKRTLQEYIIDNSASNKRKFNLYNYTVDDPIRPIYRGVCYDTVNKCAIATDAHMIVVDNAAYDPTVETRFADQIDAHGRISLDKYGNRIEGVFPSNYRCVFPADELFNKSEHLQIDIDELNAYIKRAKAYMKVNQLRCHTIRYKVGGLYFDANMLLSFLIATDGNICNTPPERHATGCAIWYTEERRCLLMPVYLEDDDLLIEGKVFGQEEGLLIQSRYC